MSVRLFNRIFIAAAVIGAVSLVGTSVPASGRQDPKQQEEKKPPEQKKPDPKKPDPKKPAQPQAKPGEQAKPPQQQAKPEQQRPQHQAKPQQQARPEQQRPQQQAKPQQQARPERQRPQQQAKPEQQRPQQQAQQRLPQQQQQQRVGQQQQRIVQYSAQFDEQQRRAPQVAAQLQQQHRTAQYSFQLQYMAGRREQQVRMQRARGYDYDNDPFFFTAFSYRYSRGGRDFETNEYGANVLRQAVNFGYAEGYQAGQADREDRWAFDYQDCYAYQDGDYGYDGFYVERDDYNYYFREGFRRGYDDGYYGRYQYGLYADGRYSIQGPQLTVILDLRPLR